MFSLSILPINVNVHFYVFIRKNWKQLYIASYRQLRDSNKLIKNKPYDCESYLRYVVLYSIDKKRGHI
jgi:hypothetical protein